MLARHRRRKAARHRRKARKTQNDAAFLRCNGHEQEAAEADALAQYHWSRAQELQL